LDAVDQVVVAVAEAVMVMAVRSVAKDRASYGPLARSELLRGARDSMFLRQINSFIQHYALQSADLAYEPGAAPWKLKYGFA
jgi:hypothetical protein